MQEAFRQLIGISAQALEMEDRFLLGAVAANRKAYPDRNGGAGGVRAAGGILRINNERYYQFVIARALVSSFPYEVVLERDTHDLVILDNKDKTKWFAAVEMKRWMSNSGESEIPGIRYDIENKLTPVKVSGKASNALMLVFSANEEGKTEENIDWLADRLSTQKSNWVVCQFPTISPEGKPVDFWVAGYEID